MLMKRTRTTPLDGMEFAGESGTGKAGGVRFSVGAGETLPLALFLLPVVGFGALPGEGAIIGTTFLPHLNIVFLTAVSLAVAFLSALTYLKAGSKETVLLGAGMIVFGLVSFLAGFAVPGGRADTGVAVYNCGMLLTAMLNIILALRLPRWRTSGGRTASRTLLILIYAGAALLVFVLYEAVQLPQFPRFFVPGEGPTPVRQIVLSMAIVGMFSAAFSILLTSIRSESPFLKWYGLGLALVGIGLLGVLPIRNLGSLLSWTGRMSQYSGGVYFLIASLLAIRQSGSLSIPVPILRESHERLTSLLDTSPNAIVVLTAGRFAYANPAAAGLFGVGSPEELLGSKLASFLHPDSRRVFGSRPGSGHASSKFPFEMKLIRPDGALLEVETAAADIHYRGKPSIQAIIRDVTDRKRYEAALQESEKRWSATLSSIGDAVIATDGTGLITFMNPVAEALTGWPLIAAIEKPVGTVFRIISERSRQPVEDPVRKVLETGHVVGLANHTLLVRKDGSEVPIDDSGAPIVDARGGTMGVVLVFRDITEKRSAEEALRKSEEWLRVTLASIGDAVIATDGGGTVTFLNPVAEALTGWSAREATGQPFDRVFRIVNELTHEPSENIVSRVLRENRIIELANHTALIRRDGTELPIEDSAAPITDTEGRVSGGVVVFHDVTTRRRAEESLRRSEARYRMLHENLRDAFLQVSMDGRLIEWNDIFCRLIGYGPEELPALTYRDITPERWHEAEEGIVRDQIIPRGYSDLYEKEYRRKDGSVVPVELRTILSRDDRGEPSAMWAIVRDVSERKNVERALRQAKTLAEEANKAKSEFLAHMSHEIRTPISGIIGMVDFISSRLKDAEQLEHLSLVRESADSLLSVIGDILDLSRIESGVVELEPGEWDPRKGLSTILAHFRFAAENKGIELSLSVSDKVPRFVRTDGDKVAQVLRNLISNALKYTERGSVAVSVTGEPGAAAASIRLSFSVRDTGIGIPADKKEAIFESFVRLRKSVNERNAEGTGLGLTIVRRLTDLLGGSVTVESVPGCGSTFVFSLEVEPLDVEAGNPVESPSVPFSDLPPLSILLAEDNRINRLFLETKLRDDGHRVTTAEHGEEAVGILERSGPEEIDLVLMDVQMPVMDGIEATRAIRRLPGPAAGVPIIALTAFAMKGDEERFLEAGMNGYVTKPVDWSALAKVIQELRK